MFISELFPNDLEEAKAKPWCPIEDSAFTEWPEYGKTKDGRKSIKTEVDNEGDYRDEVESHGWVLDHSDPIDPGYPVYINKNTPGEQLHIIPDGYEIGNYHATVVLVTNQKVVGEAKSRRKKEEQVKWIPVDTVQHPAGTKYSPKNKYLNNPDYNTGKDSKQDYPD